MKKGILALVIIVIVVSCTSKQQSNEESKDPLPSWNNGKHKSQIIHFVKEATNPSSKDFIPVNERIATFDNDGTLWSEQPLYFQFYFAIDQIKEKASDHPEWKTEQPYKAALEGNLKELLHYGEEGIVKIIMATHAGNNSDEFETMVTKWLATAIHPSKNKLFTELVYQPMLELLNYLRANKFKTYIVSGGGLDFMRPFSEKAYGIPKEQVIGSTIKTKYNYNNGAPIISRLPAIDFIDDKEGKPEAIHKFIGRKPIFAAGNSDGDLQMLRWTEANQKKSFMLYIHHTDAIREWAYDRDSHIGRFDKGLDEATEKGWTIIDMQKDWKVIYPFELKSSNQ